MNSIGMFRTSRRVALCAMVLLASAFVSGCATHRDDYGGSNDIGYSPMYGAYDGAYDGSWNWSPGYYPTGAVIDIGPVF